MKKNNCVNFSFAGKCKFWMVPNMEHCALKGSIFVNSREEKIGEI